MISNTTITKGIKVIICVAFSGLFFINEASAQGSVTVRNVQLDSLSIGPSISQDAVFQINSTVGGFLPPRMTESQRDAIGQLSDGLMIYCTDCAASGELQFYNGAKWKNFAGNDASAPVQESLAVSYLAGVSNGTGGTQWGQSFLVNQMGGYLTKILTASIGGSSGNQLTTGIDGSILKIRSYVNDSETGSIHALTGTVLATSVGTPTILNYANGISFPTTQFLFDGNLYIEPNSLYVIEFVPGSGVSMYVKIIGSYSDGKAFAINGSNLGMARDYSFSVYMKLE